MIISGIVESIDAAELATRASSNDCGGLVSFEGHTRSPSDGTVVEHLEYEAWVEPANKRLAALAEDARDRWSLGSVVAVHRVGIVNVGEISILVVCAAVHRSEAFEACQWLVDAIKEQVPVWKKEVSSDTARWIGLPF